MKNKEKRSFLKMIADFTKESVNFIKQGAPVASPEQYEERMSICVDCEHYTSAHKCGLCGCYMPVKAKWKTTKCAATPPKWEALVGEDEIEKETERNIERTRKHIDRLKNVKNRGKK
tara:strand:+ start:2309 stop:2659 length:351 start_codon:yes stop_codon:yes gene_type:complete